MIEEIHYELKRLQAADVKIEMDEQFEPQAGTLAKITYAGALWHVVPAELLDLLKGGDVSAVEVLVRPWHVAERSVRPTYEMLSCADSVGVFQVESRPHK
jgi:hypothetical protein